MNNEKNINDNIFSNLFKNENNFKSFIYVEFIFVCWGSSKREIYEDLISLPRIVIFASEEQSQKALSPICVQLEIVILVSEEHY